MNFENYLIPPEELYNRVRNNNFTDEKLSDYVDFLYTLPRRIRNEYVEKIKKADILTDYERRVLIQFFPKEPSNIFWAWAKRWHYVQEQITKTIKPELSTAEADDLNEPTDTAEGLRLPDELNTDRARKYFARAFEAQFMKPTPTGAKWLKPLTRLGYLCFKIYPQPRPIAALEKYFDVRKLSSNITNASIDAQRADVIKWRAEIDKLFID